MPAGARRRQIPGVPTRGARAAVQHLHMQEEVGASRGEGG